MGTQAVLEFVVGKASLIVATLLLSACGGENDPLRSFCTQIAPESRVAACVNDPSIRRQLLDQQATERATQRLQFAANYDLRDLERGLTAEVTSNPERVEIGDLPQPLELDENKQPAPQSLYVVGGEIWANSGEDEGERSYIYIGPIDGASDDVKWWFSANQLLSPRQVETLEAICAFFGDADHPICVGDIYVEVVPDPFFGGEPAVRGAKLRQPTYEDYYNKELSTLEEWLAQVEQPSE